MESEKSQKEADETSETVASQKVPSAEEDPSSSVKPPQDGTAVAATKSAPGASSESTQKLSKSQIKKRRRLERAMEHKKRKKLERKERKRAQAIAAGRDLEQEQRIQQEQTLTGEGKRRRQQQWDQEKLPLALKSFRVCLDCAFEPRMTAKEVNSLARQIRYCYASNRRSPHPCLVHVAGLGGDTLQHLQKVMGFDEWHHRGFTWSDESIENHYNESDMSNIVYLTSDSEHTLQTLDDSKIYIIGGIVDRNRLKQAAYDRAKELGVATAKLPMDEHLAQMKTTRVLTCNHVFDILLKYREHDDWKKALMEVLPNRKEAEFQQDDKDGDEDEKKKAE